MIDELENPQFEPAASAPVDAAEPAPAAAAAVPASDSGSVPENTVESEGENK